MDDYKLNADIVNSLTLEKETLVRRTKENVQIVKYRNARIEHILKAKILS
ncbi:MAG: hypothetical protein GF311_09860 [Candidatus Lokiarchaeota archaeon]|nr:hypothetical protein [Candidatus Lokiarchaeota archaeon]